MQLFKKVLLKISQWSRHPHAPYYLAGMSFVESWVFPIPPDVMLVSMVLSSPDRAWRFAMITAFFSVAGGMLGYCLGSYFIDFIQPYIYHLGYESLYHDVQRWFSIWGFWVIIFAGFIPIPYKLFTIGAGATHMIFIAFVLASIISRSVRFFSVTAIVHYGGVPVYNWLRHYIEYVGWGVLAAAAAYFLFSSHLFH